MNLLELIDTLSLIYIVFIAVFILMIANKYLQRLFRQRKLDFTQKFIFNNQELLKIIRSSIAQKLSSESIYKYYETNDSTMEKSIGIKEVYIILSFANEIAQGINNNLYDSELMKTTYRQDLLIFYKLNYVLIDEIRAELPLDSILFHIESLFHDWEKLDFSKRRL